MSPDLFAEMSPAEMLAYLLKETGLTPVSRYGRNSQECAPIAVAVAVIISGETGEPVTRETLEYVMGLTVNDHDDVGEMLESYGSQYGYVSREMLEPGEILTDSDYLHGKDGDL